MIFVASTASEANELQSARRTGTGGPLPQLLELSASTPLPTPFLVFIQVDSLKKVSFVRDFNAVQNQEWKRTCINIRLLKYIIKY